MRAGDKISHRLISRRTSFPHHLNPSPRPKQLSGRRSGRDGAGVGGAGVRGGRGGHHAAAADPPGRIADCNPLITLIKTALITLGALEVGIRTATSITLAMETAAARLMIVIK